MRRVPRLLSVIFLSLLAGCASGGKGRMSPTQAAGSCDKPGAGAGAGQGAAAGAVTGLATGPAAIIVSPAFALIGAIVGAMAGSKSWCPDVADADKPAPTGPATAASPTAPDTAADFAARRKAIEVKWAEKIKQWRQTLCNFNGGSGSRSCNVMMAELAEQRDAELKALDEARGNAIAAAATAPTEAALVPPAARIDRQLHVRGPGACTVVGRPAGEADFQALRQELDQCWQARIAVAQGFCDKNLGAAGPPCYSAQEARKYRDDALAAFDADWRRRTVL